MQKNIRREIDRTTLPPILREFAGYKTGIENCSALTVEEYLLDLRTFFRYLVTVKNHLPVSNDTLCKANILDVDLNFIQNIRAEDIYEFLFYVGTDRQNGWAAKARKLTAIKAFFRYLVSKRKLLDQNPATDIDSPKKERALPKFLTFGESVTLLDTIRGDEASASRARDYAIVTLFLNCGMRLSELCGIDLKDLDPEMRSLRVIGKGSKERVIYLNTACREALSDYLEGRSVNLNENQAANPALFLSGRGNRISVKTVQWMVGKYLKAAGLENRGYSVHKLRHTAATLMYQSGNVDVRVLKDILGHEQLNTTQIYTHVSDAHMQAAMEQNPLSKIRNEKNRD